MGALWSSHGTAARVAAFTAAERRVFSLRPSDVCASDVGPLKALGRLTKRLAAADKKLEQAQELSLLGALGLHS